MSRESGKKWCEVFPHRCHITFCDFLEPGGAVGGLGGDLGRPLSWLRPRSVVLERGAVAGQHRVSYSLGLGDYWGMFWAFLWNSCGIPLRIKVFPGILYEISDDSR